MGILLLEYPLLFSNKNTYKFYYMNIKKTVLSIIASIILMTVICVNFHEVKLTKGTPIIVCISNHSTGEHITEVTALDIALLIFAYSLMLLS